MFLVLQKQTKKPISNIINGVRVARLTGNHSNRPVPDSQNVQRRAESDQVIISRSTAPRPTATFFREQWRRPPVTPTGAGAGVVKTRSSRVRRAPSSTDCSRHGRCRCCCRHRCCCAGCRCCRVGCHRCHCRTRCCYSRPPPSSS